MQDYDKIDLISKKSDIVYKKMIFLLAAVGGSGSYAVKYNGTLSIFLFIVAGFFSLGLVINYFELNKMKNELEEIEHG